MHEKYDYPYYRGRFGVPDAPSPWARPPEVGGDPIDRWQVPAASGWSFGKLKGDLNPIHWSGPYARAHGFRRALHHPEQVLGQCLARVAPPEAATKQRLDAWLRGPVYLGDGVALRAQRMPLSTDFALYPDADQRPAISASWRTGASDERLIEGQD